MDATIHDDDDPLLFIEAIPNAETRTFVRRALTYAWIYAARLGRRPPSLDELVAGEFPRFTGSGVAGHTGPGSAAHPLNAPAAPQEVGPWHGIDESARSSRSTSPC